MAINWAGVEDLLDAAATEARTGTTIDEAMHKYNAKVIVALKLMISTAKVDGTAVVNGAAVVAGGSCTPNGPIAGANIAGADLAGATIS